jgi:hypothetical protein
MIIVNYNKCATFLVDLELDLKIEKYYEKKRRRNCFFYFVTCKSAEINKQVISSHNIYKKGII